LYPALLLGNKSMVDGIEEWRSPDFRGFVSTPCEILVIGAILCWGLSSRPRRIADVILVLGLVKAALFSVRHIPIFAITCAPIVVEHLGSGLARLQGFMPRRRSAAMALR